MSRITLKYTCIFEKVRPDEDSLGWLVSVTESDLWSDMFGDILESVYDGVGVSMDTRQTLHEGEIVVCWNVSSSES